MKLAPQPQNIMEWIALKADLIPVPLAHTHICFMLSKAILEAFSLNVFEAFKEGSKNIEQIWVCASGTGTRSAFNAIHSIMF